MAEGKKQKRPRRSFTDEFKAGAVRLVLDEGKTIPQVARDLDLTESSVRNWVERARADRGKGKPGVATTAEKEELATLRKEVRQLRLERDILKKAAVGSTGQRNRHLWCMVHSWHNVGVQACRRSRRRTCGRGGGRASRLARSVGRSGNRPGRYTASLPPTAASLRVSEHATSAICRLPSVKRSRGAWWRGCPCER
jgi:transposase